MPEKYSADARAKRLEQWEADNFGFLTSTEAAQIRKIAKAIRQRAALTSKKCNECGRVFDLYNSDDADEWAYGHDCEAA